MSASSAVATIKAPVGIEDFKEFLTFTDRDSYLVWAGEWKSEYAGISEDIRALKRITKELQKSNDPDASTNQSYLSDMKNRARLAISLRRASKVLSGQQRAIAREASGLAANQWKHQFESGIALQ